MENIMNKLEELLLNESGATAVEYAILLALIAGVMVVSVRGTGEGAATAFDTIATAISNVVNN